MNRNRKLISVFLLTLCSHAQSPSSAPLGSNEPTALEKLEKITPDRVFPKPGKLENIKGVLGTVFFFSLVTAVVVISVAGLTRTLLGNPAVSAVPENTSQAAVVQREPEPSSQLYRSTFPPLPTGSPPPTHISSLPKLPAAKLREAVKRYFRFLRDRNNGQDYYEHLNIRGDTLVFAHASMAETERDQLVLLLQEWCEHAGLTLHWVQKPERVQPVGCHFQVQLSGNTDKLLAPVPQTEKLVKKLLRLAQKVGNELYERNCTTAGEDPLNFEVVAHPQVESVELLVWPNGIRKYPSLQGYDFEEEIAQILLAPNLKLQGLVAVQFTQRDNKVSVLFDWRG